MQTIIERELDVQLVLSVERSIPVPARLTYRSDDPYAVHITFHIGSDAPVQWTFARELLVEGVFRPAGQGDVRVWPEVPEEFRGSGTRICLSLRSPDGDALLRIPGHTVAAWLERTMRVVPPGREGRECDLEGELAALLAAPFADCGGPFAPNGEAANGTSGPATRAPRDGEGPRCEGRGPRCEGEAARREPEERHDRAGEPERCSELPPGCARAPGRPDLGRLTDLTDLTDLGDLTDLTDLAGLPELGRRPAGGLAPLGDLADLADVTGPSDLAGPAADLPERGERPDLALGGDDVGEAAG